MANEQKLIDADALYEKATRAWDDTLCDECYSEIINLIDEAPTVDAVEVVRCAKCKYWLHIEDGFGDCTNRRFHIDGCADPTMKADDFCSCGERRTNGETERT